MNKFSVKMDNDLSLLYREDTRGIPSSELERPGYSLDELAYILNIDRDILSRKDYWYKYKGELYYLKKRNIITYILNELLGEYMSRYMELPTIVYELALEDEKVVGLLSKNFRRCDKEYKMTYDLGTIDALRLNYALSIFSRNKELHEMLIRLIIKDYFVCMRDRNVNTLCEKSSFHVSVAPLFDYEKSFSRDYFCDVYYNPLFTKNKRGMSTVQGIDMDILSMLMKYDKYFQDQFDKMMEFDMVRCLDNLRDYYKINIPEEVGSYYVEFNNNRKEELIESLKKVG